MRLPVKKIDPEAIIPTRANPEDAGLDLYSLVSVVIKPLETVKIRTGIAMQLPHGTYGQIFDRSGMAAKGLKTGGGVLDNIYRGEIIVVMTNLNPVVSHTINKGDKIAQLVVIPILFPTPDVVVDLNDTARGGQGFGSTDRKEIEVSERAMAQLNSELAKGPQLESTPVKG